LVEAVVDLALIITTITSNPLDWLINLVEQGFHHISITDTVLGQSLCRDSPLVGYTPMGNLRQVRRLDLQCVLTFQTPSP